MSVSSILPLYVPFEIKTAKEILSYCQPQEMVNLFYVCKAFRELVREDRVWRWYAQQLGTEETKDGIFIGLQRINDLLVKKLKECYHPLIFPLNEIFVSQRTASCLVSDPVRKIESEIVLTNKVQKIALRYFRLLSHHYESQLDFNPTKVFYFEQLMDVENQPSWAYLYHLFKQINWNAEGSQKPVAQVELPISKALTTMDPLHFKDMSDPDKELSDQIAMLSPHFLELALICIKDKEEAVAKITEQLYFEPNLYKLDFCINRGFQPSADHLEFFLSHISKEKDCYDTPKHEQSVLCALYLLKERGIKIKNSEAFEDFLESVYGDKLVDEVFFYLLDQVDPKAIKELLDQEFLTHVASYCRLEIFQKCLEKGTTWTLKSFKEVLESFNLSVWLYSTNKKLDDLQDLFRLAKIITILVAQNPTFHQPCLEALEDFFFQSLSLKDPLIEGSQYPHDIIKTFFQFFYPNDNKEITVGEASRKLLEPLIAQKIANALAYSSAPVNFITLLGQVYCFYSFEEFKEYVNMFKENKVYLDQVNKIPEQLKSLNTNGTESFAKEWLQAIRPLISPAIEPCLFEFLFHENKETAGYSDDNWPFIKLLLDAQIYPASDSDEYLESLNLEPALLEKISSYLKGDEPPRKKRRIDKD
jgi:hypothetical protein